MISFDRDECQAGTPAAVFIAVIRCYPLLFSLLFAVIAAPSVRELPASSVA